MYHTSLNSVANHENWVPRHQQPKRTKTSPSRNGRNSAAPAGATAPSLKSTFSSEESNSEEKAKAFRPRRTADQIARLFCCPHANCDKRYGSEGALKGHIRIKHPDQFDEYQRLRVESPLQIIVSPNAVLASASQGAALAPGKRKRASRRASRADSGPLTQENTHSDPRSHHFQANPLSLDPLSRNTTPSDDALSSSSSTDVPHTPPQDPTASYTSTSPLPRISVRFSSEEPEEDEEEEDAWDESLPAAKRRAVDPAAQTVAEQLWEDAQVVDPYSGYYGSFDMMSSPPTGFLSGTDGHGPHFAESVPISFAEHHHE